MSYKPSEIRYEWKVTPEELEQLIFEGWAVIAISPFTAPDGENGSRTGIVAVLRRPLSEDAAKV